MLSPEFEKFPAPESHIQYSRYSYHTQHQVHDKLIKQQYFTTQVSVLLPGCVMAPPEITHILTHDTEYYHITALPLHHFTSPTFIQAFVDTGDVYMLSCNTMLDVDDSAVLTPDGKLRFLVDKFKYHRLPLSGRLSQHILRKPKDKYLVTVDLKKQWNDKRVLKALMEADLVFDFWLAWLPNDPEVCPSSIAKYFCDLGFEVRERETQIRMGNTSNVLMPRLGREEEEDEEEEKEEEEEMEEEEERDREEEEEEKKEEESMEVEEEEARHKQQQECKKIVEQEKQSEEKTEDEEMFIGFLETASKKSSKEEIASKKSNIEETASKKPSRQEITSKKSNIEDITSKKSNIENITSKKRSREEEIASKKPRIEDIASKKPSRKDITSKKSSREAEIASKKPSKEGEQIFLDTKGNKSKEETWKEQEEEMDPQEVLEWIGCQALGINLVGNPTTVCDIDAPHPSIPINNVCTAHFTGFFLPHIITSLFHKLREWLRTRRYIQKPWLSMTVYGHPDSLVAWGGQEHRYNVNGDNFYTFIISRKEVRVFKISGPRKPARLYAKSNNNK